MSLKKSKNNNRNCRSDVRKIAITGGIGSGKSYICRRIEALGFPIFYCDDEAQRIIREDPDVHKELCELLGPAAYTADGTPDKRILRNYICQGKPFAQRIDSIVHPKVGQAFLEWSQQQDSGVAFMECALLFEAGFDQYADFTLHVSAPQEIRIRRVMQRDNATREQVLAWMQLQWPEEEKAARADAIICNDGKSDIDEEIRKIIRY